MSNDHSWTSASRKLTTASAFRHPLFQSSTGPKKCRTASAWFGTGSVPASLFLSFRYRTDRMPDSPTFPHLYIRTRTRTWTRTRTHWHRQGHGKVTWTLTWTCSMEMGVHHGRTRTSSMDAGMKECRWNVSSGIVSFPLVYNTYSGIGIPASWPVRSR